MVKIDIISGFLGAGKTTFIRKLLAEALSDTKVVLIENEFGEIGIDSDFLQESGVKIREMNSGCICCSLVGDFKTSLQEVLDTYKPERIIIEPSGVGKLSDVIQAIENVGADVAICGKITVVDVNKCKLYLKNFGEFFLNQVEAADTILLSRTDRVTEEKVQQAVDLLRQHNERAVIVTTPWNQLNGKELLQEIEQKKDLAAELLAEVQHRHEHGGACDCEYEHHYEHGENCDCGHGYQHVHGDHCDCGHDHHAEDVFVSWGMETPAVYTTEKVEDLLKALEQQDLYGIVLRAKGMLPAADGTWTYFDYVPGEWQIRKGKPTVTGKVCIIGSGLKQDALQQLLQS